MVPSGRWRNTRRCSGDVGVVRRAWERNVQRDLDAQPVRPWQMSWSKSRWCRARMDRLNAPLCKADGPGAPGRRSRRSACCSALADLRPIGWIGGRYTDVESHRTPRRAAGPRLSRSVAWWKGSAAQERGNIYVQVREPGTLALDHDPQDGLEGLAPLAVGGTAPFSVADSSGIECRIDPRCP